jgi:hypothetical protein
MSEVLLTGYKVVRYKDKRMRSLNDRNVLWYKFDEWTTVDDDGMPMFVFNDQSVIKDFLIRHFCGTRKRVVEVKYVESEVGLSPGIDYGLYCNHPAVSYATKVMPVKRPGTYPFVSVL